MASRKIVAWYPEMGNSACYTGSLLFSSLVVHSDTIVVPVVSVFDTENLFSVGQLPVLELAHLVFLLVDTAL